MSRVRVHAKVIGTSSTGNLRLRLGDRERDVPAEQLPAPLRRPNSEFVAILDGTDFVGIEQAGRAWISIQEQIRSVLNNIWDPIGVASAVDDEYDGYIGGIYSLLRQGSSKEQLEAHLLKIETDRMGLDGLPGDGRSDAASQLLRLNLPAV